MKKLNSYSITIFAAIFISTHLLVALVNDGFMGTDEYWNAMVKYLPAQTANYKDLVAPDDVKSPLQVLPMYLTSQISLKLGTNHPYDQYRFSILAITIANILIYLLAIELLIQFQFFNWSNSALKKWTIQKNEFESLSNRFLYIFPALHFASAFTLTRPMFESLAAPWVLFSFALFVAYQESKKIYWIVTATIAVSLAFILRQQVGIGALTIPLLLTLKKDWKGFFVSSLVGFICFILAGIPDIYLRSGFHYSLLAVLTYNLDHGHEYGNGSILFYPFLLTGLSFLPWYLNFTFSKTWMRYYFEKLKYPITFILLFVVLHSYFPQKFERFMISIVPLLLVLMIPFFSILFLNFKNYRYRIISILIINFILFAIASFQPSQKNIIDLALYIDHNPSIKNIYSMDQAIEWLPEKFIYNNKNYNILQTSSESLHDINLNDCHTLLVATEMSVDQHPEIFNSLNKKAQFNVNLVESFAYRFNKKNNIRRAPLLVFNKCS